MIEKPYSREGVHRTHLDVDHRISPQERQPTVSDIAAHRPLTLLAGPRECLDCECEDYFTGDEQDLSVEMCSHIREERVCAACSTEQPDGEFSTVTPWPCPQAGRSRS